MLIKLLVVIIPQYMQIVIMLYTVDLTVMFVNYISVKQQKKMYSHDFYLKTSSREDCQLVLCLPFSFLPVPFPGSPWVGRMVLHVKEVINKPFIPAFKAHHGLLHHPHS